MKKKINFKQGKYIIPLLILPFLLFFVYQYHELTYDVQEEQLDEEINTSLGDVDSQILKKDNAYDLLYEKDEENRTMLEGLEDEQDSLLMYTDNLNEKQKRYIDSLKVVNEIKQRQTNVYEKKSYYNPKEYKEKDVNDDSDFKDAAEIMKMLNEQTVSPTRNDNSFAQKRNENIIDKDEYDDPVDILRRQMIMMDSLEKSNNPEYQAQLKAEARLSENKEKMEKFLNSTLPVTKNTTNSAFNSVFKNNQNKYIMAVVDENNRGYLGSRIRLRILEDIYISNKKVRKGTILYASISGFSLQRVNLNVVSILINGEIFPINLGVYDTDGMKGLYVPRSTFREMMRELGENSVQGTNLEQSNSSFFQSILSKAFTSTSQMIANIIRANKVKLKYNSYIYLIDEKQFNKN